MLHLQCCCTFLIKQTYTKSSVFYEDRVRIDDAVYVCMYVCVFIWICPTALILSRSRAFRMLFDASTHLAPFCKCDDVFDSPRIALRTFMLKCVLRLCSCFCCCRTSLQGARARKTPHHLLRWCMSCARLQRYKCVPYIYIYSIFETHNSLKHMWCSAHMCVCVPSHLGKHI